MDHWVRSVETLLNHCGDACVWMMELLAVQHGTYLRLGGMATLLLRSLSVYITTVDSDF